MEHFFTFFFQSKEKDKAADTLFIIIIKQMDKKNVDYLHYGNTGCGVFKRGIQN